MTISLDQSTLPLIVRVTEVVFALTGTVVVPIPEPCTLGLLAGGALLVGRRRRG